MSKALAKIVDRTIGVPIATGFFGENPRAASIFAGLEEDLRVEELMHEIIAQEGLTDPPMVWKAPAAHIHGQYDINFYRTINPEWMIVKGHRRWMALRMLEIFDPAKYEELFPGGKVQCNVLETSDYGVVIQRKQDHAHVVGLTSAIDLMVNIDAGLKRKLTREGLIKAFYPIFDAVHGSTAHGERKINIAELRAEIDIAKAAGDDKEKARLKGLLVDQFVLQRQGLCQHYIRLCHGPTFLKWHWCHMQKVAIEVPEEYQYDPAPKSLTNAQVKELYNANSVVKGKAGNKEMPTDACIALFHKFARTEQQAKDIVLPEVPRFRGNKELNDIANTLSSEGGAEILCASVKMKDEGELPDLRRVDEMLHYMELIKASGETYQVEMSVPFTESNPEGVEYSTLYDAIRLAGKQLVIKAMKERVAVVEDSNEIDLPTLEQDAGEEG